VLWDVIERSCNAPLIPSFLLVHSSALKSLNSLKYIY